MKMKTKMLLRALLMLLLAGLSLAKAVHLMVNVTTLPSALSPIKLAAMEGLSENVKDILLMNTSAVDERDSLGMTPLHWAAIGGHDDVVLQLLRFGADPNARDEDNNTALHLCTNPETTRNLVLGGSEVNAQNKDGATALHLAAGNEAYSIVMALLRFGAMTNISDQEERLPLDLAIRAKNLAIVKLLKSCGAMSMNNTLTRKITSTITTSPPTTLAPTVTTRKPKSTRVPEVRILTEKEKKLKKAAKEGAEDDIADLCAEGVDPNVADISDHNFTPLHLASAAGDHLAVLTLLRCGANINFSDIEGNTALHLAIKNEYYKVCDILLLNGANFNIFNRVGKSAYQLAQAAKQENFRRSSDASVLVWFANIRELSANEQKLHNSVKEGWYIDVAKICKAGVDIQVKDVNNRQNTALHVAVSAKFHTEGMIETLVKCGAKVDAKNADGNTPLHLAIIEGRDSAFTALLLNRADLFIPNSAGRTAYQLGLDSGTPFIKRRLASPHYDWYLNSMED